MRVAVTPNDATQLLIGVYNGDPASPCASDDPQVCNNDGLDFELDDPALLMVEGAYKYNQERLAGTIKVGGWNHFGTIEVQRISFRSDLIAVIGRPGGLIDNNWGIYAIIDQLMWRKPDNGDEKTVGVFARVIGAPQNRNLIDIYFDGGVTFSGMTPGRPDDSFAIGFAYTGVSDSISMFDVHSGVPAVRNHEMLLEICYTMQLAAGWTLQPDFQHIWQKGQNAPDEALEDAAVFGARTTIAF